MSSGPKKRRHPPVPAARLRVAELAIEVVAKLVSGPTPAERLPREVVVEKLIAAVTSPDPAAYAELRPELRRARVTAALMADVYIPEVARRLGQSWQDDDLSFAAVSVGCARLQAILREVSAGWSADERGEGQGRTVLVIVPPGEQHTLGAMVLVSQLRRRGVSACLRFAPEEGELCALLKERQFDVAMITLSSDERVAAVARVVRALRDASPRPIFVALGGPALQGAADLQARTGVDLLSSDLELVLKRLRSVGAAVNVLETV